MIPEWLWSLPPWLTTGALMGLALSCCVAGLFVIAERYFPAKPEPGERPGATGDTETRRRTEIRAYLDSIEEPYAEGHFVAGQHVAFYLPSRDVAITFDPRAYFRIEHTPTYPVLVEHELPGVSIGARLPFETPEVEFEDPSERPQDPAVTAYAELGLPVGAGVDDVKSAYREQVKQVHPDQGGDEQDFKRLREAYTTAKQHAS